MKDQQASGGRSGSTLGGERLYLRPMDKEDLLRCERWFSLPEVRRNLVLPLGLLGRGKWLRRVFSAPDGLHFAVVLKAGERPIGTCGLSGIDRRQGRAEAGIVLGEGDTWGHGYGPEALQLLLAHAFDVLGLRRVVLHVRATNLRAVRAFAKVGFACTEEFRVGGVLLGRRGKILAMEMTAERWAQARAPGTRT